MRLTRASSYAIQALAYLAAQKSNLPVASHLVARDRGIPERFLLKVLKPLVSARVLQSIKGPNGGYRLIKSPNQITMLEVIEAVDGPIRGQASFSREEGNGPLHKRLDQVCAQAAEQVRHQFEKVSIAELASKVKR